MDERLQGILDSVQRTATSAASTASGAAYSVGKKANQLLSTGKLNIRIAELKAEVARQLQAVGEMVYATHTGDPTSSDELLGKLREIDVLNAQINSLSAELWAQHGTAVCPACGAAAKAGDVFCRSCGARL